ncbi:histidine kinase [Spirillospora sp. NBC_00431]
MIRLNDLRRVAAAHTLLADGLLAAAVYGLTLVVPTLGYEYDESASGGWALTVRVATSAVLVFRRRSPWAVLAATTTGMVAYASIAGWHDPLLLAHLVAIYTVVEHGSRRSTLLVGLGSALFVSGAGEVVTDLQPSDAQILGLFAWSGLAAAAGDATRGRRAYVADAEERAERAERTREEEAHRRVMAERLRIARELHDVLAHHVTLINVQAGAVAQVMGTDPERARESLAHIRRTGRSALQELRTTVGLLRQPDAPEGPDALVTEPSPGLGRLPELLASFSAGGQAVEQRVEGAVRELPAVLDLTAYRVIQEALTNVRKHAPGSAAHLDIRYGRQELRIEVTDTGARAGRAAAGDGTGHGLVGMRERALAVGGAIETGPRPEGGYRVLVVLPIPAGSPPPVAVPAPASDG